MGLILSARDGSPTRSARGYGPVVCFGVWSSQRRLEIASTTACPLYGMTDDALQQKLCSAK